MSPKIVDKKERIDLIIQAAIQLFSQKGFAATSIEQIVEKTGVSKAGIYVFFESKNDIFEAAIREWVDLGYRHIADSQKDINDPIERLLAFVAASIKYFNPEFPENTRLYIGALQQTLMEGGVLNKKRDLVKEVTERSRRIVINTLLEGVSKGIFRPEIARDAEKLAINLIAYLDGIFQHNLISETYFVLDDQINSFVQNMIRAIVTDQSKSEGEN